MISKYCKSKPDTHYHYEGVGALVRGCHKVIIHSSHDIILYSFFLPESRYMQLHSWVCNCAVEYAVAQLGMQLHSWVCSCTFFSYLGTQLHGNQSLQYCAYFFCVQLHIMMLWQPRTHSYTLIMLSDVSKPLWNYHFLLFTCYQDNKQGNKTINTETSKLMKAASSYI